MLRKLLLLLYLLTYAGITQAQRVDGISPRIIGGSVANPTAYPWVTALLNANESNVFIAQDCGGSLIDARWVLTAAHCVDSFSSASELDVAIGFADLSDSTIVRTAIANIYIHPGYTSNSNNNDIALLELATPSSNDTLALADNSLTDTIYSNNFLMTVIGWGTTVTPATSSTFPLLLQEAQIPPHNFSSCRSVYGRALTNNMICAAGTTSGGKDACQGDSGGPMFYQDAGIWYLTGIISFGTSCARPNIPGVYTRVANYLSWINGTITFAAAFPDGYQFGYHGEGVAPTQILTLTNNSGTDITVTDVSLTTMTNFIITGQTCTTGSIANNASCTINLRFQTTGTGTQFDTLNIVLNTGTTFSNPVSGTVLSVVSAETALDETPARIWYSGGDGTSPNWFNNNVANSNGNTAMRSGYIGDNEDSILFSYFSGPTLNYRWKSSSEQYLDFLSLYVDGVFIASISGNRDWGQCSITLSPGEHRIAFIYEKNSSNSSFQDAVWLDSVNTVYSGESAGCLGKPITSSSNRNGGGGGISGLFLTLLLLLLVHAMRMSRNI